SRRLRPRGLGDQQVLPAADAVLRAEPPSARTRPPRPRPLGARRPWAHRAPVRAGSARVPERAGTRAAGPRGLVDGIARDLGLRPPVRYGQAARPRLRRPIAIRLPLARLALRAVRLQDVETHHERAPG